MPLPAPSTVQVESEDGPLSVSLPAPPSNVTGTPALASEASMVNVSLPAPPTSVRLAIDARAFDCVEPSIVTTMFAPSTDAEIVCASSPEIEGAQATGGDGPLPGSDAGSFGGSVTSVGGWDVVLLCCAGIVPPVAPAFPPLPPPVPTVAPPLAAEPCVSLGTALLAPVSDGATAPLGSGVPPPVLGAGLVSSGPLVPPVVADESARAVSTEKSCRLPALFAPTVATRSFTCGACGAASAEGDGATA